MENFPKPEKVAILHRITELLFLDKKVINYQSD